VLLRESVGQLERADRHKHPSLHAPVVSPDPEPPNLCGRSLSANDLCEVHELLDIKWALIWANEAEGGYEFPVATADHKMVSSFVKTIDPMMPQLVSVDFASQFQCA